MIQELATRHKKKAALSLFFLFYLQLVAPNINGLFAAPVNRFYSNQARSSRKTDFVAQPVNQNVNNDLNPSLMESKNIVEREKKNPERNLASPNIGGPGQPEMSTFKSVNQNDMVDLFSGDFSYNIPLLDVGGYPVNIHYNSNVTMDQEASFVGLGWNINPGTIGRTKRGLPDDFDGTDTISKTQNVRPNQTIGITKKKDMEIVGTPVTVGKIDGIFYNTYNGIGYERGTSVTISSGTSAYGKMSGGLSIVKNTQTGLDFNASMDATLGGIDRSNNGVSVNLGMSTGYNSRSGMSALQINSEIKAAYTQYQMTKDNVTATYANGGIGFPVASISFAVPSYTPGIKMPFSSTHYSFKGRWSRENTLISVASSGMTATSIEGYVSKQEIKPADRVQMVPAAGYLYLTNSNDRPNVIQDFNREKELVFNASTTPHIAIPQYTYDIYSISGEGTGGMFRPYRSDIGFVRDYNSRTRSKSERYGVDVGLGDIFHAGVDVGTTTAFTQTNAWETDNDMSKYIRFRKNDTTYQAVYFRNPGEKTMNSPAYYESVGNDDVIRGTLENWNEFVRLTNVYKKFNKGVETGQIPVTSNPGKKERDKKTQVISYLTAGDAERFGLDKKIYSYMEDSIPVSGCFDRVEVIKRVDGKLRKKQHLSEITVLNGDGRRYIYGLPVYNVAQKDVTFSIDKQLGNDATEKGLAAYDQGQDNSTSNNNGKQGLYTADSTPGYAHSFLLTGIVSPDYVDIKSDGITEDDLGDAVKFNYTRVYGGNGNYFQWRTPSDSGRATYDEGLKSYIRDDKASYLFGKKEVWYLNSIESKTMVAVFTLSSDRKDIYSVRGENGGYDKTKPLRKLDKIDLYSKSDLFKNGANAKPVKTVHFRYSYTLCKGVLGDTSFGKLTLDSIYFSYNGNEKGRLNPYVFKYHAGHSEYNPNYHPKKYDRWGNYKDYANNPGGLSNSDYPYAEQDKTLADKYAAVWVMDEIRLPSGGKIKVRYEADDYAYVQNKRAARFFKIKGVGGSPTATPNEFMHDNYNDKDYVFVESSVALIDKADVFNRYLEGNKYIYFKILVRMPETDSWGTGKEFIPVYAEVEDYGLVDSGTFWIKLKRVEGESPLVRSSIQFLRLNLPSKAYPGSEVPDIPGFKDAIGMLVSKYSELFNMLAKFGPAARLKGWCKTLDNTKSFVRLNSPDYKKLGGGLRVKRIEVWDNWKNMTGQKESVYGQDYSYTKTENINGRDIEISSGVASYEPMIGAEENPFRQPLPYSEKLNKGAPANDMFSEEPLGESYFPVGSVDYSSVKVRTINAKAKSANGWAVTEFFTTKDFPTIVESSILDADSKRPFKSKFNNLFKINVKNYVSVSQGFKVELNDMNGKVKAQYTYAETDSTHPIGYVQNFYKVDNDTANQKHLNNTVWIVDSLNGHINRNGIIGKDVEVMNDIREESSYTVGDNTSANLDVSNSPFLLPFIVPSVYKFPQKEVVRYRSIATVKIIQRYGILDSVVAMDKGSVVTTKNLLYDGETGEVLLSRTNNEFNDPIFNFSYPAHWAYSGMGMAYKNIDAVFTGLKLIKGKLYYGGNSTTAYPVERFFESGDELYLKGNKRNMQSGDSCLQFAIDGLGIITKKKLPSRSWVIDASKAVEGDSGLYFIDEDGRPLTGSVDTLRVLRSGKRNLLDASVGSIVSMANPIRELTSGNFRLVFDTNTKVLNTSAVTYKDMWQIQNYRLGKDSIHRTSYEPNFQSFRISPTVITKRLDIDGAGNIHEDSYNLNPDHIAASFNYVPYKSCYPSRKLHVKTILSFDLSQIPEDATIYAAGFTIINNTVPTNIWYKKTVYGAGGCLPSYTYDWSLATDSKLGNDSAYIRRITSPWNYNTPYSSIISTNTHKVGINGDTGPYYGGVDAKDMVQDMLTSGNYGVVMEMKKTTPSSFTTAETNYVSIDPDYTFLDVVIQGYIDSVRTFCTSAITDSMVNPYRVGILGNWRMDRAYTFYHDRKEKNASAEAQKTNIRKDGLLADFSTFWQFSDSALVQKPDTKKWVWNSASSAFNKRGLEIENYDPLGRYNAGLYGYNQTLPVAVAQNGRYREVLYDGFEDYFYQTKVCVSCANVREYDFVTGHPGVSITDTQSHTGIYSMKVLRNKEGYFSAAIRGADSAFGVSLQIDSTPVYQGLKVAGTGIGLTATYTGFTSSHNFALPSQHPDFTDTVTEGPLNFNWSGAPRTGMYNNWYSVKWKGKVQAPNTGIYKFYVVSDKNAQVYVNGFNVANQFNPNVEASGQLIFLQFGQLYDIEVSYAHQKGKDGYIKLSWERLGGDGPKEIVPKQLLYKDGMLSSDSAGSIIPNIHHYCIAANNAKTVNITKPTFSPIIGQKYVISGWVKMDSNDCNTVPPLNDVLIATIEGSPYSVENGDFPLIKTGARIEGWQRYELVFTAPTTLTTIKIRAVAPSGRDIFVDDIRFQPFNSGMKSYAYDAATLRLMAELDENNYATFFEYDDDGTLIRLKKETERGVMTVKETRSALLKDN